MTWMSMADLPVISRRELTDDDRGCIEDVLDAAAAWAAGAMPFYDAASIGGIQTPAYTRMLAVMTTPKDDPRWRNLMDLLEVLIRSQGYRICRQGVFTSYDIRESNEHVARANVGRFGHAA